MGDGRIVVAVITKEAVTVFDTVADEAVREHEHRFLGERMASRTKTTLMYLLAVPWTRFADDTVRHITDVDIGNLAGVAFGPSWATRLDVSSTIHLGIFMGDAIWTICGQCDCLICGRCIRSVVSSIWATFRRRRYWL